MVMTRERTWQGLIELGAVEGPMPAGSWVLSGTDLGGTDLSGANLVAADLSGVDQHEAEILDSLKEMTA